MQTHQIYNYDNQCVQIYPIFDIDDILIGYCRYKDYYNDLYTKRIYIDECYTLTLYSDIICPNQAISSRGLAIDGFDKIMNRGCYFKNINYCINQKILINIKVKLFTKNIICYHLDPSCNDRHIQLSSPVSNHRYFTDDSSNTKNTIYVIASILNVIFECDFLLINIAFQKMSVPLEIQRIIKIFYYNLMGLTNFENHL